MPALLIYGTGDGTVPYDTGYAFGTTLSPFVYGSIPIAWQMDILGILNESHAFDSLGHAFYMDNSGFSFPNQYWRPVFTLGHEFLYKIVTNTFTNISESINDKEISIYPNPADEHIFLDIPLGVSASFEAWITNLQGTKIQTWKAPSSRTTLDISDIPQGIYFLNVRSDMELFAKKIMVFR